MLLGCKNTSFGGHRNEQKNFQEGFLILGTAEKSLAASRDYPIIFLIFLLSLIGEISDCLGLPNPSPYS